MPDAHVVTFTEPHPDRDRGCWASHTGSPCNQAATSDIGLCADHLAAYRQHPSHQEPVPAPAASSWLSRVIDEQIAPGGSRLTFTTDVDSDGVPWLPADVWEAARTSGSC